MEPREALKWTLLYRGISIGAFALGGVLIAAGVFLGFASAVRTLFTDPAGAVEAANPLVTIAFGVLGLAVWQVGKTYALFVTVPEAAGRAAAEEFDTEHLRSELLESIDDHLSDLQVDVEETRRNVQELKRAEHAAEFDETDVLGSSTGAAIDASGGATTERDRTAGDSSRGSNATGSGSAGVGGSGRAGSADTRRSAERDGDRSARSASDAGSSTRSKTPPDARSDEQSPSRSRRRDPGSGDDEDETDDPLV